MYVIHNPTTGEFAMNDQGKTTTEYPDALKFDRYGQASDASQNFGPDFYVRHTDDV